MLIVKQDDDALEYASAVLRVDRETVLGPQAVEAESGRGRPSKLATTRVQAVETAGQAELGWW